jgi:AhpD family alkylhydroperoxidase
MRNVELSLSRFASLPRLPCMARIESLPAAGSGLFVRFIYRLARRRFGRVPAPVGITAHHRWVLAAMSGYEVAFEKARAVDPRLKELAMLKVATEVGCRFCIDIGSAIGKGRGVTEEQLRDLPDYIDSEHFSRLEKRILDFAVHMTRTPQTVSDELFACLSAQLGTHALVELTAAIAWENYRARFNHAVGAKEEGYTKGELCLLSASREPSRLPATTPLSS